MLVAVRYVLPAGLLVIGVVCLLVVNESARVEAWAGFTGAGLSVFLLNFLYRLGVQGDADTAERDAATRAYFDEHGEWPEEEKRVKRWNLPEGVRTADDPPDESPTVGQKSIR